MLFKKYHLEGIKTGQITLAYRKWKKPAVKEGSLLNTPVGQIRIVVIEKVEVEGIQEADARNAGFKSLDELLVQLGKVREGHIYRMQVAYHAPDPRIELRNRLDLTEGEFCRLRRKLERLDRYSKVGPWTHKTLLAIQANPKLKAADLAIVLSKEKEWLKVNIRKLKNLGLTISHHPGYEISPLGKEVLKRMII